MPEVLNGARVLVVDDTEANRYAVARILRLHGCEVTEAASGEEALRLYAEREFDLVTVDVRMPGMSGMEVCRRIKADPAGARTPLLQISASFTDDASRVRGLEAGADGYLVHPLDPALLAATARALLRMARAEEGLRESERRYRFLAESIPQIVWTAEPDGRVDYANSHWTGYTGFAPDADPNERWRDVVHPEDLAETEQAWADARASGRDYWVQHRLRRYDGAYRWFLSRATAMREPDGAIRSWFGSTTDIDEVRQTGERLRHAHKLEAVGRLAGGMAHEINNMMTAIIGFGGFALRRIGESHGAAEDVREMIKAANRSAGIVRQVLAFGRRQHVQLARMDLHDVLRDVRPMLLQLAASPIDVSFELMPSRALVVADRGQLEQLLVNVTLNARDAMATGGSLTFRTARVQLDDEFARRQPGIELRTGPYVELAIRDTGHGMTPEVLAHALEPFFTTKPVGQGSGLGLSTVYGIVKQSGGYVFLESEPGAGTTVRIYLAAAESADALPTPGPDAVRRGGEMVLVVEDEPMVRALASRALEEYGYRVVAAADGVEALAALDGPARDADLVLTDAAMPNLNGRQLADRIAVERPELPVLFMSAHGDAESLRRGLVPPAARLLQKPFTPEGLANAVRECLDIREVRT
jgi:PAS domain S-box-containing protein